MPVRQGRAVVLGASIGGLLAARVLADAYDEVLVVERDSLPLAAGHRKGVPQARHAHALLAQGRQVLETLFPGLTDDLAAQGAAVCDGLADAVRVHEGHRYTRAPLGCRGLLVSRCLLESEVRRRVLALEAVCMMQETDAIGLLAFPRAGPARVSGVRLARAGREDAGEVVPATLVVDATGRGSRLARWLGELGCSPPAEEKLAANLGYATRWYRRRAGDGGGALMFTIAPTDGNARGAVMFAQEGDRWLLTLAGYGAAAPPGDEPGFLDYARRLAAPDVYQLISRAEPLGSIVRARFPSSLRRRFERLGSFPCGLLAFGDAISSFNPIYGQGMTVAAMEAVALRESLEASGSAAELAARFFRRAAAIVDRAWILIARNDARFTDGPEGRGAAGRALAWYLRRLHAAARRDRAAAAAFLEVTNLMAPPTRLLRPRLAARVLWRGLVDRVLPGASAPSPPTRARA